MITTPPTGSDRSTTKGTLSTSERTSAINDTPFARKGGTNKIPRSAD